MSKGEGSYLDDANNILATSSHVMAMYCPYGMLSCAVSRDAVYRASIWTYLDTIASPPCSRKA